MVKYTDVCTAIVSIKNYQLCETKLCGRHGDILVVMVTPTVYAINHAISLHLANPSLCYTSGFACFTRFSYCPLICLCE